MVVNSVDKDIVLGIIYLFHL